MLRLVVVRVLRPFGCFSPMRRKIVAATARPVCSFAGAARSRAAAASVASSLTMSDVQMTDGPLSTVIDNDQPLPSANSNERLGRMRRTVKPSPPITTTLTHVIDERRYVVPRQLQAHSAPPPPVLPAPNTQPKPPLAPAPDYDSEEDSIPLIALSRSSSDLLGSKLQSLAITAPANAPIASSAKLEF
jgi:hypothetical protein